MSHSLPDTLVQPLAGHSHRRLSAGTDCSLDYIVSSLFGLKIHCRLATDVTCYSLKKPPVPVTCECEEETAYWLLVASQTMFHNNTWKFIFSSGTPSWSEEPQQPLWCDKMGSLVTADGFKFALLLNKISGLTSNETGFNRGLHSTLSRGHKISSRFQSIMSP